MIANIVSWQLNNFLLAAAFKRRVGVRTRIISRSLLMNAKKKSFSLFAVIYFRRLWHNLIWWPWIAYSYFFCISWAKNWDFFLTNEIFISTTGVYLFKYKRSDVESQWLLMKLANESFYSHEIFQLSITQCGMIHSKIFGKKNKNWLSVDYGNEVEEMQSLYRWLIKSYGSAYGCWWIQIDWRITKWVNFKA
jgi:hypothetical protein